MLSENVFETLGNVIRTLNLAFLRVIGKLIPNVLNVRASVA